MYSVKDPTFKKTIVVGKKASSIGEAKSLMKLLSSLPRYCFQADSYNDCLSLLYGSPNSDKRSVLIFDWQGNPLQKIDLPFNVQSVEVDFDNRTLITSDYETEELYFHKY